MLASPVIGQAALRRAALALPLFLAWALPAVAADWTIDKAASRLSFVATQNGAPVAGAFSDWSATISLDPADLANARIEARVQTGSASTGQAQIDGTLPSDAWFNSAAMPEAVFTSSKITAKNDGTYEAAGELTIKGISQPLVLPFTLSIEGDRAHATAEVPVARLAYGVGTGIPAGTVADEVKVVLDISASR